MRKQTADAGPPPPPPPPPLQRVGRSLIYDGRQTLPEILKTTVRA
jgi:hypothetical protein